MKKDNNTICIKNIKSNIKGITLISLVVTIIIIIILSTISMNAILGNNGLMQKAMNIKNKNLSETTKKQQHLNELFSKYGEENTNNTFTIELLDSKTEELIPISGAILEIYKDKECTNLYQKIDYSDNLNQERYITNQMPPIGTYYIKFVQTPIGINKIEEILEFKITNQKSEKWSIIVIQGMELPTVGGPIYFANKKQNSSLAQGTIKIKGIVNNEAEELMSQYPMTIYEVANITKEGDTYKFEYLPEVEDYISFYNGKDNLTYYFAETLRNCMLRDRISEFWTGTTDANGKIEFPLLETNKLYLFSFNKNDAKPVLYYWPDDGSTYGFDIDMVATVNLEKFRDLTKIKVKVEVEDDVDIGQLPNRLMVDLLNEDGEVVDTVSVSLSEEMEYIWTDVEGAYDFSVLPNNVIDFDTVDVIRDDLLIESGAIVTTITIKSGASDPDIPGPPDGPDEPPL